MSDASRVVAGRYRLVSPIGAGGMGAVWRAQDELLGVEVALKEVTLGAGLTEEDRTDRITRAMREARSAARLRSNPHVVTVHDAVEHDGLPWIVMEFVASVSLHDAVRDHGPLPHVDVAKIGLAMLDALKSAHSLGVLHRDVKPSNILLAEDGRVLLTDFGIATQETDATLTRTGYVGTPRYMAPERLDGRPATPATDLFALGGTLYFAVEGRPPFQRDSAAATIGAIMFVNPDASALAGPLAPVLFGLLAKQAGDRPSAAAVSAQLSAVAAGAAPPPLRPAASGSRGPAGPEGSARPGASAGSGVSAGWDAPAGSGPRGGPVAGLATAGPTVAAPRPPLSAAPLPPPLPPPPRSLDRTPVATADRPRSGRERTRKVAFVAA
ncbi:MAG: serine/threonine-protein kinase, partial [Frankia sp.]